MVFMTENHYEELVKLLNEKISELDHKNDEKRKEINRLKAENRKLRKQLDTTAQKPDSEG